MPETSADNRDYASVASEMLPHGDLEARLQRVVDALWKVLHDKDVSWVGFYLHEGADELVLGPRRDKPACSPIGMHGACGLSFQQESPLLVRDVRELGDGYIACDPRDQSEVVLPFYDDVPERGRVCRGVLDLDSFSVDAFDASDVAGLQSVLDRAGLGPRA